MPAFETLPADTCKPWLPAADFADAFAIDLACGLDAPEATRRGFARMPQWVSRLMALRNAVVAPLGLKAAQNTAGAVRFGIFPVLSSSPDRVVLGFDDRHLDFRIVVDVAPADIGRRVTITTLVARHNLFGRLYLAAVMPFHKRIVPVVLAQMRG